MAQKRSLLDYPHVIGHGVGWAQVDGVQTRRISRIVLVERKVKSSLLAAEDFIPPEWAGRDGRKGMILATDVIEVGRIRALQARTDTWRPAPGGVSVGHKDITAGTLGMLVKNAAGDPMILSNNHVLANSNEAVVGDPIYQPGPYDGGGPDDMIATLESFIPILFPDRPPTCGIATGAAALANLVARLLGAEHRLQALIPQQETDNLVDAAIARPVDNALVEARILEIEPYPKKLVAATLGMRLRKSGRTTGLTVGQVLALDLTVDVDYGGKTARFANQFMAGPMSAGGDSGSVVVNDQGWLVGLLFAGSDQTTIFNPIDAVFSALGLRLE